MARNLPERRGERSLLSKADDLLLVVVAAVVAVVVAVGLAWVARR